MNALQLEWNQKHVPVIKIEEDDPELEIEPKVIHQKMNSGNILGCIFCGKTFCRPYSLKRHIEKVHEGKDHKNDEHFSCQFCNKSYTKRSLRWHMKKEHGKIVSKRHRCELCMKSFNKLRLLELHNKYFHEQGSNAIASD